MHSAAAVCVAATATSPGAMYVLERRPTDEGAFRGDAGGVNGGQGGIAIVNVQQRSIRQHFETIGKGT